MTYYIVKHGSNDWRTHLEDGIELGTYTDEPRLADAYADVAEHLGLSSSTATAVGKLLAEGFADRNITIQSESVPWS